MTIRTSQSAKFSGGIAAFPHEGIPFSVAFMRSINYRIDPRKLTLLPRTIKESGSIIQALPKWQQNYDATLTTYFYDEAGNIYSRSQAGVYTLLGTMPNSHGNGLNYFQEDDYIYFTSDALIGRYGPLGSGNPQFVYDFFGSQGGVPLNTNSFKLIAASSQYASANDASSLDIAGDLSIDLRIKPASLPTGTSTVVLVSKWNQASNERSYRYSVTPTFGVFGDGSSGSLHITADTGEAPIDSACSGTSGTNTLTATNASFVANQVIMVHQSQGTGTGTVQITKIQAYTAGTITTTDLLNFDYATGAQVRVLPQYTDVTIDASVTYFAKEWDGTTGGIIAFLCTGTTTVNGVISAQGGDAVSPGHLVNYSAGYRAGSFTAGGAPTVGKQGEGTTGPNDGVSTVNNGTGGGGGQAGAHAGAGGGHSAVGGNGDTSALGGITSGSADLTTIDFGGGGGGGGSLNVTVGNAGEAGGGGGGIIFLSSVDFEMGASGLLNANGGNSHGGGAEYPGGGGAGGAIRIRCQTSVLGTNQLTAIGGIGTTRASSGYNPTSGAGGAGFVVVDYFTSFTGTTTPTLNPIMDSSLISNSGYALKLELSANGTNVFTATQPTNLVIDQWQRTTVNFSQADQTATFLLNTVAIGTLPLVAASIFNSTAKLAVGASYDGSGNPEKFFDGLIDEVIVDSADRSDSDLNNTIASQLQAIPPTVKAYYKFNGDLTDASGNSNTLTGHGSPVFVTDVPFPSPTTRVDIDQQDTTTGDTYTLPTAISEASTDKKTFTPQKDPQKSIAVLIDTIGSGDWTITVHDPVNNVVASKTVLNANLATGYYEFIFANPWRPLINQDYHFHLTSTVADGKVVTTNHDDLETVSFRTYYQFLVSESAWHPVTTMLQIQVFGNERYLGTYEATLYDPNAITLAAGYTVRCFGFWNEYLAIGVQKGANITDNDAGRVYFWDGIAPTFNYFIDVPEGGINALLGTEGTLYIWAGYKSQMLSYVGGATATKLRLLPNLTQGQYMEIYPDAVNMWQSLVHIGSVGNGTDITVPRGVFSYGEYNPNYPPSLSFDYPISTGNFMGTNVRIGTISATQSRLLIGWQDGIASGVDYVDLNNPPYPNGTVEFIIDDDNTSWKEKSLLTLTASFDTLAVGESITVKYMGFGGSVPDDLDWQTGGSNNSLNNLQRWDVGGRRYVRVQTAVDLATTGTTSPTFYSLAKEADDGNTEQRV